MGSTSDYNNTIRKIVIATGEVTTLAGSAGVRGSADGTGAAASFYWPDGITTDGTNLYVADSGNVTIRKIVIATGEVTTLAGSAGVRGSADGTGAAASFNWPGGLTAAGTALYVSDVANDTIRKIAAVFAANRPQTYSITDLGTLAGGDTWPQAVNNSRAVVGRADIPGLGYSHAFLWTAASGLSDLGQWGFWAWDINDQGQMIVNANTAEGGRHAFVVTTSGVARDLGTFEFDSTPGIGWSEAFGINNQGQVAGNSYDSQGRMRAYIWTEAGGMRDLGTLGGAESSANDVSELGTVVGWSQTATWPPHAFLWTEGGGMRDLGTLMGGETTACSVNSSGQVVGDSATSWMNYSPSHAFIWTEAGGLRDLGTLGGARTYAQKINDQGQVVGSSNTPSGAYHAFLWTESTGIIDLNTLMVNGIGWELQNAQGINAGGDIVGGGMAPDGVVHAYLATVNGTNAAPVLSPVGNQAVNEGQTLTFTLSATDPDTGQVLSYAAGNLPTGASFNPATRTFTWTPASGSAGTYQVTFTVTDNGTPSLSASQTVTITVTTNYTVTTAASPSAGGTVSLSPSGGSYASGTQVTLTATPAAGYQFQGWSGGATGTANPLTVTVSGNTTITADFTVEAPQDGSITPLGSPTVEPLPGITVSFGNVTTGGITTVIADPPNPPGQPSGYRLLGTYYDISTTAAYGGTVTVCFQYDYNGPSQAEEERVRLLHWEGSPGHWVDVTSSLDTTTKTVCGTVSHLSPFVVAIYEPIAAQLTVKPAVLNLATSQLKYTCLIDLPAGNSEANINLSSLSLSVPAHPEASSSTALTGFVNTAGQYAAKFSRAFLRQVPLGEVEVKVTGQLNDGSPFEGTATVTTWKPLVLRDIDLTNAKGQPETQFAKNEPMVFLRCSYEVDPRAGTGKVSALVNAFGHKFRSPWQPVSAGANTLGYTVLIPASAATGPQDVKVTLQLKKAGKIYDAEVRTLHIEVTDTPWQP
jgi:uncharacterized repeat protein (TIGR02543 family)